MLFSLFGLTYCVFVVIIKMNPNQSHSIRDTPEKNLGITRNHINGVQQN